MLISNQILCLIILTLILIYYIFDRICNIIEFYINAKNNNYIEIDAGNIEQLDELINKLNEIKQKIKESEVDK